MADPLSVSGVGAPRVDESKWRKLTPQEIIKEQSRGEDVPSEIVAWAEQMVAYSMMPDDVTYEDVDGETGLEALNKLGLDEGFNFGDNAVGQAKVETPGAVKDPEKAAEVEEFREDDLFDNPEGEQDKLPDVPEDDVTLADRDITTDDETIRRRKERRGLL